MSTIPNVPWRVFINEKALENAFGKPEYKPMKQRFTLHRHSKKKFTHSMGDWLECSQEEFDANRDRGEMARLDQFMGRKFESFWYYEMRCSKPGWPQEIIKQLKKEFS